MTVFYILEIVADAIIIVSFIGFISKLTNGGYDND